MNIRFNETMFVPEITFCMSHTQAWSHFQKNVSETNDEWDRKIQVIPAVLNKIFFKLFKTQLIFVKKEQLNSMNERGRFLNSPWEPHMVMESYYLISTLTSMERETTARGAADSLIQFNYK